MMSFLSAESHQHHSLIFILSIDNIWHIAQVAIRSGSRGSDLKGTMLDSEGDQNKMDRWR